eukprot:COSAG02_NODE_17906_length_972_cov_1.162658_1_plen_50_part_10
MSLLKETLSPDEFLSCADHLLSLGVKDFFKQKTAYVFSECDWSSDVCSSD